jgi:glycolate oxidase FAD binding subunit
MKTVIQALEAICETAEVRSWEMLDPLQQEILSRSVSGQSMSGQSMYWVYPNTQDELAAIVVCAYRNRWGVLPCGHASKLQWGGIVTDVTLVVSTERLNRLIDHAVGDLTVTAEAGISFTQLQDTLSTAGQFLAIDPSYRDRATLGGIIATADTGSLRHRYNSVRDMLLGISFVRSDGELVKAGGRVVKNVAGYDLMKLLTGSYGTLGIVTQATFRVYPLPQASQTVVLTGEPNALTQATQTLLSSALTPICVDLLSVQASQAIELSQTMSLVVRFQSISESVQQQTIRLTEVGVALGLSTTVYSDRDEETLWNRVALLMSPSVQGDAIVCKIGMRSTQATTVLDQITHVMPTAKSLIHAGSGLGRLMVEGIRSTQLQEVRSLCESAGGFLSVLQASIAFKQQLDGWGYRGNALGLMKQIKQKFDPESLLSPHRFVG